MSCGFKKGDKVKIRIGRKMLTIVVVGHSDFPGYLEVAWPGTRHHSKIKVDWIEEVRTKKGSHYRI
jgi:hypothetical protein